MSGVPCKGYHFISDDRITPFWFGSIMCACWPQTTTDHLAVILLKRLLINLKLPPTHDTEREAEDAELKKKEIP